MLAAACAAQTIAFVRANVFDGAQLLHNQTVVIEGGLITAVGSAKPPANAERIDAKGKTLLPGLIDSYGDARGAGAALRFGVTTFVDSNVQVVYDDGFAWGLRLPHASFEALHEEVEKIHKEGRRALVEVGSLRESMEALNAEADGLIRIFAGAKSDPEFVKLFVRRRAFLIPVLTMIENASGLASGAEVADDPKLAPLLSAAQKASLREKVPGKPRIEGSFEALHQLHAAQALIVAGDGYGNPGTAAGASLHQELALLVRGVGMSPLEALTAATARPAELFGLHDRGVIAVGKRADLLLVNGNPAHQILATRDIVGVWKAGVAVKR